MAEFQPSPLSHGDDYGFIFITLAALSAAKGKDRDKDREDNSKAWESAFALLAVPLIYLAVTHWREKDKKP